MKQWTLAGTILLCTSVHAADRYWVAAGPGNWNNAANWSTVSGGPGGASVPGAADLAWFNSGGAGDCALNVAVNVAGLRISTYPGTITQGANSLTLASNSFFQSGGTFVGGTALIRCNGIFSLTGGSFTSTSGTMRVGGNLPANATIFIHGGGTFLHNNGRVVLDPSRTGCTQGVYLVDVSTSTQLYDLGIEAANTCGLSAVLGTAAGDTLQVLHDLTHENGYLTGLFAFENDLWTGSSADGGQGQLIADGNAAQQYHVAMPANRTSKLVVDKSGGALVPAAGTTALSAAAFSLLNGNFTAPTGNLYVGGTQTGSTTLFNHAAGTFAHNNGRVVLDPYLPGCAQGVYTVDINTGTLFHDLDIAALNGCGQNAVVATATGDTLRAVHDLTHENGYLNGFFAFENDLWIGSSADGGQGQLIAEGSAAQQYHVAMPATRTSKLVVDKSGGALVPAAGTTQFSISGFDLRNGDFTAPVGNLNIGGTQTGSTTLFNHAAGTFAHNNGRVVLDPYLPGCAQGVYTVDINTGTLFHDLDIAALNGCGQNAVVATATGDTLRAVHDLTHENGYLNGFFAFENDLWIGSSADGGQGQLIAEGSAAQQYHVAMPATRTSKLVVDKSGGALIPAAGTTQFSISGFDLRNGDFTAPTGNLYVGGTQTGSTTLFNHAAGTFAHNNGRVVLDPYLPGCAQGVYTVDINTGTLFHDLDIAALNGCGQNAVVATATGDTLRAVHDLTHENGYLNGFFAFENDLWIGSSADGGQGQLIADGNAAQQYHVAMPAQRTAILVVDKSSAGLVPATGTDRFSVSGFRQLLGDFTAPSVQLNIGGTQPGGSILFRHVAGAFSHNNGLVLIDPYHGACAATTYTLEVGPNARFHDLEIAAANGCGQLATVTTAAGDTVHADRNLRLTDGIVNGLFGFGGDLFVEAGTDGGTGEVIFEHPTAAQTYWWDPSVPRSCRVVVGKASGSVTPASSTSASMSGLTLVSGHFQAPSAMLRIGGTWATPTVLVNHQGGTFDHNGGTTILDPRSASCTARDMTLAASPAMLFNKLRLEGVTNCSTPRFLIPAADTLACADSLYFINSPVNTGVVSCMGHVVVQPTFDGGTGKLVFNGSGTQHFDLTGATALFDGDIVLHKPAGKVVLDSPLLMDAGAAQKLDLRQGLLESATATLLVLGDNVTVTNANPASFVQGPMRKVGNDAFWFPVGANDTAYAPIRISAPANTAHHFTAEYIQTDPDAVPYPTVMRDFTLDHLSRCEYWMLNRTNGASNVTVSLTWAARSCGVTAPADLRVARWDGGQWKDRGNGSWSGTPASGTLVSSGAVTAFGPFTLGSSSTGNPLPVELVSFEAVPRGHHVDLQWITASEQDNSHFVVEKTLDGMAYTPVVQVPGAGNSQQMITYSGTDPAPWTGLSYYRLKQVDFDGNTTLSDLVPVHFQGAGPGALLYPNPTDGTVLRLQLSALQDEEAVITVLDAAGRTVARWTEGLAVGQQHIDLARHVRLTAGAYTVHLAYGGALEQLPLVISQH